MFRRRIQLFNTNVHRTLSGIVRYNTYYVLSHCSENNGTAVQFRDVHGEVRFIAPATVSFVRKCRVRSSSARWKYRVRGLNGKGMELESDRIGRFYNTADSELATKRLEFAS